MRERERVRERDREREREDRDREKETETIKTNAMTISAYLHSCQDRRLPWGQAVYEGCGRPNVELTTPPLKATQAWHKT